MARVLGIHHNNVFDVVQRCHRVLVNGGCLDALWAPLTKKIRSDKLSEDVVRRHIACRVYGSHPTHYLMET
jgi:hypothetical protein